MTLIPKPFDIKYAILTRTTSAAIGTRRKWLSVVLSVSILGHATEIRLQNGTILSGNIESENDSYFKLDNGGAAISIKKDQIVEIDGVKYRPKATVQQPGHIETIQNMALIEQYAAQGKTCFENGDYLGAARSFNQAAELEESLPEPRMKNLATLLSRTGHAFREGGQYPKALAYYNRALNIHKSHGTRKTVAETRMHIGTVYKNAGKLEPALEHYSNALTVIKTLGDEDLAVAIHSNIGVVFEAMGLAKRAIDYYDSALKIAKMYQKNADALRLLRSIGLLHEMRGEHALALGQYTQAKLISQGLRSWKNVARDLVSIGSICYYLGDYERAAESYSEAIKLQMDLHLRAGAQEKATLEHDIATSTGWLIASHSRNQNATEALQALVTTSVWRANGRKKPPRNITVSDVLAACPDRSAVLVLVNADWPDKTWITISRSSVTTTEIADSSYMSRILEVCGPKLADELAKSPTLSADSTTSPVAITTRVERRSPLPAIAGFVANSTDQDLSAQAQNELWRLLYAALVQEPLKSIGDVDTVYIVPDKELQKFPFGKLIAPDGTELSSRVNVIVSEHIPGVEAGSISIDDRK